MLRTTLRGEKAQVKPVVGEAVPVRETVPLKPWSPVTVSVELPDAPASIDRVEGLTETV